MAINISRSLYPLQNVFCFPWYFLLLFHHCNVIIKFVLYKKFINYKHSIYNKLPKLMREIREERRHIQRYKRRRFETIAVNLKYQYLSQYQQAVKDSLTNYTNIPNALQILIFEYIFSATHIGDWNEFCTAFKNDDNVLYTCIVNILQINADLDQMNQKTQSKIEFERNVYKLKRMKCIATLYTLLHIVVNIVWLFLLILFWMHDTSNNNKWVSWILLFCYHPLFSFTLLLRYYKMWDYWDVLDSAMHLCCKSTGNNCIPCLGIYLCCPCYTYYYVFRRCLSDLKETTDGAIIVDNYEFNTNHYENKRIYIRNIYKHKMVKQFVFVFAVMILCLCWGVAMPLMMISMFHYFLGYTLILHLFCVAPFFIVCLIIYMIFKRCILLFIQDEKEVIFWVLFFTFWTHSIHVLYIAAYALRLSVNSFEPENIGKLVVTAFTGTYCDHDGNSLYVFDFTDWRALFLAISWFL